MSWDIIFTSSKTMGTKDLVREQFLSICEKIISQEIPRRGSTEVTIDNSFTYEVMFIGHKKAIESLALSFNVNQGDPLIEQNHPLWNFIKTISKETGWTAFDTYKGEDISL